MWLQLLWLADTSFPSVFNNGITVELLWKMKFPSFPMDRNIYVGWRNTAKMMRPLTQLKSSRHRFLRIWVVEIRLPIVILVTRPLACFFPSVDRLINFSSFVMNKPLRNETRGLQYLGEPLLPLSIKEMWIERLFCCVTLSRIRLPLCRKVPLSTLYQLVNSQLAFFFLSVSVVNCKKKNPNAKKGFPLNWWHLSSWSLNISISP